MFKLQLQYEHGASGIATTYSDRPRSSHKTVALSCEIGRLETDGGAVGAIIYVLNEAL
jgi:hypothetical protein